MREAIPSVARILGHPIHPMLVPFPIAFLCALPFSDLVFLKSGDPFWNGASWWLCLAGVVTALVAAVAGATDFWGRLSIRAFRAAWIHFLGNLAAAVLSALNLWLRWKIPPATSLNWCLALSFAVLAILGLTGWYGGELSYRYRVGMIPDE